MTNEEWNATKHRVTDEMRSYTRPFASPLVEDLPDTIRLKGSGSYVSWGTSRILLTCEHVARHQQLQYKFCCTNDLHEHPGPWVNERHPVDAAFAMMDDHLWRATQHEAESVPSDKFARHHKVSQQAELIFFRGYADENSAYGFGVHQANGTGYCSQEVANAGDDQIFELFWEPSQGQITTGTSMEAVAAMSFDDPGGFSGSLVWNTRYLETIAAGEEWTPENAVVTGLLRRWDAKTKTLLVWRVEHLIEWLATRV
jgi:hypothetical protein